MVVKRSNKCSQTESINKRYRGGGLVNSLINKLPIELHIPGYNFCGPGTKLSKRLARGDRGVNKLDEACREHDIAYNNYQDLQNRHEADEVLLEKAKKRFRSSDASFGEKAAALGVATAMKAKVKFGMGCTSSIKMQKKRKRKNLKRGKGLRFNDLTKVARSALKGKKFKSASNAISVAVKAVKSLKGRRKVRPVRVVPVPKTGGFLPLIPLFAALGALGSIGGGAAAIAKAVNATKDAKEQLKETQRHNGKMESIALNKTGKGLYLKPYKKGLGLFLAPWKSPKAFH
jgi:hypothetical protein